MAGDALDDVLDGVALDFFARDGRIDFAYPCIEHAQIVIDFCRRPDCRAWIGSIDFLFDGDGRGDAVYPVAIGLLHLPEELPRIC